MVVPEDQKTLPTAVFGRPCEGGGRLAGEDDGPDPQTGRDPAGPVLRDLDDLLCGLADPRVDGRVPERVEDASPGEGVHDPEFGVPRRGLGGGPLHRVPAVLGAFDQHDHRTVIRSRNRGRGYGAGRLSAAKELHPTPPNAISPDDLNSGPGADASHQGDSLARTPGSAGQ